MKLRLDSAVRHEHVQYTIRGVPEEVDRALRKKAAQLKISLNQMVVNELTSATIGSPRKADFSDLVGQWAPDREFDEVIASQRQIDWEKWK
jgi:hypothetical protein